MKYKILKAVDVSGFKILDPVVRLAYGEEPRKQLKAIGKYLVIPILFLLMCLGVWNWVGPNHKTKSGEVPTPDIVWESAVINHTIAERESQKQRDFLLSGADREAAVAEVDAALDAKESEVQELQQNVAAKEAEFRERIKSQLAPLQTLYDEERDRVRAAMTERRQGIRALADAVAQGNATTDQLLDAVRDNETATDLEKNRLSLLKQKQDGILTAKYKPLEDARKLADKAADELLFLNSRKAYLLDRNLELKLKEESKEMNAQLAQLATVTSASDAERLAKRAIATEQSIERLADQQYAKSATIYIYIYRSVFTVFVGFFMAAIIAIPLGILCGLNKIFMACMTPLIAIFKPVSPVVWLLIFQIVIGAFFPDPATHPLFRFFDALPGLGSLGINPALIFSACTVAMCAVWPAMVNTALGVSTIDQDHINVARVLRLGFFERLTKIIIPSALPLIFAGLRISMGVGWMVLIAAEALSSSDGLGKFVWDEYQNGSSLTFANIIFACFVVGIIGFFLDRMMVVFQRLVSFDGAQTSV